MSDLRLGIVLLARSDRHEVRPLEPSGADLDTVTCRLRGRLRKETQYSDLVVTGDRVLWQPTTAGNGVIEQVLPRETRLNRRRPGPGRLAVEQVIVSNPDQALFIFSVREPLPHLRLLDRLLVIADANELPALVCANKIDLVDDDKEAREPFGIYEKIGYQVIYSSAATGQGIEELASALTGKLSVLCGPSGVGKSSLLNAIQPRLGLATHEVSEVTGKGRHTTVSVRLWPLDAGGYVADTPGLREAGFYDIEPEDLAWHFWEMRPFLGSCRFSSCSHTHEPDCAVKAAVGLGAVSESRYDSYCRLFAGE